MMHTVVKSHRSGRDVVPKKFVDEICGVLQDADIGLRKYAIKDFRTYIPVKLKELGWSDNIYLDRTSKINITSMRGDIGLISKDYLKSVCCTDEWGAFYGKALHDKSCVIYPIIIDDSAPPALISQIKYLRFNGDEYASALSTLLRSLRKQFSK